MSSATETLKALRDAARRRDWNACRAAAEAALSRLPAPQILGLAHQEVQRRLPLFERHHPNVNWPRDWLGMLAAGSPRALDEASPEVWGETPGPGGGNFRKAVLALSQAAAAEDGAQRAARAVEAIAEAVMAEMMETGGSAHREVWDRWYRDALADAEPSEPGALLTLMNDPRVAAIELAAWNRLADELSAALGVR